MTPTPPALESKANKPQPETPSLETKPKPTIPDILTSIPPPLDINSENTNEEKISNIEL